MYTANFIEKKRWFDRISIKLFKYIPTFFLRKKSSWQWLQYCPATTPDQNCFTQWNQVIKNKDYQNYQRWVRQNSLTTLNDWRMVQQKSFSWQSPPKISIVTPIYNTQIDVLEECITSIRAQAYPYWQLILVDDGSENIATHQLLKSDLCKDPRIQVHFFKRSQGISNTTNIAIEKAQGDYVVFLDHDDRLALDALYLIAKEIRRYPGVDIIYSDRDMISPKDVRYMHLFKPDWSPETLLAGNYIFHLMCYRHSLITQLGGLRAEFDGSQDYDLILRAAETRPQVRHIQKVLYHWRQYQGSVSLDSSAKEYAFKAGLSALNETLKRRGIAGKAVEISSIWRGNYQLILEGSDLAEIDVLRVASTLPVEEYTQSVNQFMQVTDKPYIAIISRALSPVSFNALHQLAAWLKIEGVALATGSILAEHKLINYAGATYHKDGSIMVPYKGWPVSEPGYMAVTKLTRNISAPHPFCVVIQRKVWQQLNGLNADYQGFYSLLDFSLRALAEDLRCVSVPQAQFLTTQPDLLTRYPAQDKQLFYQNWQEWLEKGDPYYNPNLANNCENKLYHMPD